MAENNWDSTAMGHYWDKLSTGVSKIPKGRYTIEQSQNPWHPSTPELAKEMTFGISSPVPTVFKYLTHAETKNLGGARKLAERKICAERGD